MSLLIIFFCYVQLFHNILTSTELRFPQGALEELHPDCVDLCRSLLRLNPGDCYIKGSLMLCLCVVNQLKIIAREWENLLLLSYEYQKLPYSSKSLTM